MSIMKVPVVCVSRKEVNDYLLNDRKLKSKSSNATKKNDKVPVVCILREEVNNYFDHDRNLKSTLPKSTPKTNKVPVVLLTRMVDDYCLNEQNVNANNKINKSLNIKNVNRSNGKNILGQKATIMDMEIQGNSNNLLSTFQNNKIDINILNSGLSRFNRYETSRITRTRH